MCARGHPQVLFFRRSLLTVSSPIITSNKWVGHGTPAAPKHTSAFSTTLCYGGVSSVFPPRGRGTLHASFFAQLSVCHQYSTDTAGT